MVIYIMCARTGKSMEYVNDLISHFERRGFVLLPTVFSCLRVVFALLSEGPYHLFHLLTITLTLTLTLTITLTLTPPS